MNDTTRHWLTLAFGLSAAARAAAEPPAAENAVSVTVTAERIAPFDAAPQLGLAEALAAEPRVLLNSQGGPAAQNDLSVRGSAFSGAGLTLNGLALRHAQTEHFHAELPLTRRWLDEPEVWTGLEQAQRGDGFLLGAIGLRLSPLGNRRALGGGGGQDGWNWQHALGEQRWPATTGGLEVAAGAFAEREAAAALDEADNDARRAAGGARLQARTRGTQSDLLVAAQEKRFGARGYYGVRPDWDAEEELQDTLALFSTRGDDRQGDYRRLTLAARATEDEYRLFWPRPEPYANRHELSVLSAAADGRETLDGAWNVVWRGTADDERLQSNQLGDHRRGRLSAALLPGWEQGRARLTAGARVEAFRGDTPAVLPQAGAELELCAGQRAYAAYSETVRQPSYTELNYESPGSLGNSGLRRQSAQTGELGGKGALGTTASWRGGVFLSRSRRTVDWIRRTAESERWEAADLGRVDTRGAELTVASRPLSGPAAFQAGYAWLDKDGAAPPPYASRYALDYPEHLLRLAATFWLTDRLSLTTTQTLRRQTRNPLRAGGRTGVDGRLACRWTPSRWEALELTLLADNIWNDDFQVFAGQPAGGARWGGGLTVYW